MDSEDRPDQALLMLLMELLELGDLQHMETPHLSRSLEALGEVEVKMEGILLGLGEEERS